MEHSFDIDIAKRYGIPSAVLLKHLHFWIEKNRANDTNFYDGYYWTYNSKKAFSDLFPYMTARQIDYALQKLIDDGIIVTGNYNKSAYDRTLWYAITKKGFSILQNCEMERTEKGNGNSENEQPIPDKKPVGKQTDSKPDGKEERKNSEPSFDDLINAYSKGNEKIRDLLGEWLKVRKAKRAAMTNKAIELNLRKLDGLAAESNLPVEKYLEEIICRGWQAFYPINNFGNNTAVPANRNSGGNVFLDMYNDEF